MQSGAVSGRALMERAGAGVVAAILDHWSDLAASAPRAIVLCGPGNNGGDGYVIARLLAERGWQVAVHALGPSTTADGAAARADWPGPVATLGALAWEDLSARPLVIDALFGTGLLRPVAPGVWGALAMAQESGCRIVAVDVLSGLCADSGRIRSEGGFLDRPIDLTVTFERPRLGHMLDAGAGLSGRLVVTGIGLEHWIDAYLRQDGDLVADLAHPGALPPKAGGHKFTHGHALVLAGGVGQGGAARLAARGALRVGAGLVTLACPPAAVIENAARLDAIMLRPVPDAAALADLLGDGRINALCLGPGLGVERARDMLGVALGATSTRGLVLDADALTALAGDAALASRLHPRCVLTPHGGEFARLFPDLSATLAADPVAGSPAVSKVDVARSAAARARCVVLFKGADTVIAAPDGRAVVSAASRERAAPWLATAGAGDVLAGIITGLLARGLSAFAAAETGAWLHVEAARSFGPGLIAEDLPEALPGVFRQLGL